MDRVAADTRPSWLPDDSPMAELLSGFDWSKTPVGPIEHWPQSLKTAAGICMNSSFPMLIWWGEQLIQIYNDAYRPIVGDKHPASLGQPGAQCWAEIWDVLGPLTRKVIDKGESTWDENLLLLMNRYGYEEETYFTFSYSPIPGEGGETAGLLVTCVETTEQVLSERRLRSLRDLSGLSSRIGSEAEAVSAVRKALAHNSNDLPGTLLYLFDEHSETVELRASTGLDKNGLPLSERLSLEDDSSVLAPYLPAVVSGEVAGPLSLEVRLKSLSPAGTTWPEGSYRTLLLPLKLPAQDRPYGFVVALLSSRLALDGDYRSFLELLSRQITNVFAGARSLEATRARVEALAELDKAKTVFFSNVSHEFRTPLTLMLGPIDELLGEDLGPDVKQELQLLRRAALRLQKLVNSLLDFARIEAGRAAASFVPLDLSQLTTDLSGAFRSLFDQAGLEFALDIEPAPEPVYVDREMWEKVVFNLLSNAFKYTHEGTIRLTLGYDETRALLSVEDSGIGIPEDDLPKLFERFHRVEDARGRSQEGTGIGLALVQELIKLHGGHVSVASRVGEGSRFQVRLPRGKAHLPADRIEAAPTLGSTATGAQSYLEEAWSAGSRPLRPPASTLPTRPSASSPPRAPPDPGCWSPTTTPTCGPIWSVC